VLRRCSGRSAPSRTCYARYPPTPGLAPSISCRLPPAELRASARLARCRACDRPVEAANWHVQADSARSVRGCVRPGIDS